MSRDSSRWVECQQALSKGPIPPLPSLDLQGCHLPPLLASDVGTYRRDCMHCGLSCEYSAVPLLRFPPLQLDLRHGPPVPALFRTLGELHRATSLLGTSFDTL